MAYWFDLLGTATTLGVDPLLVAACESLLLARRASRPCLIPDVPENLTPDEAMRLLTEAFSDPRVWVTENAPMCPSHGAQMDRQHSIQVIGGAELVWICPQCAADWHQMTPLSVSCIR
jgi:hypothetical protein